MRGAFSIFARRNRPPVVFCIYSQTTTVAFRVIEISHIEDGALIELFKCPQHDQYRHLSAFNYQRFVRPSYWSLIVVLLQMSSSIVKGNPG